MTSNAVTPQPLDNGQQNDSIHGPAQEEEVEIAGPEPIDNPPPEEPVVNATDNVDDNPAPEDDENSSSFSTDSSYGDDRVPDTGNTAKNELLAKHTNMNMKRIPILLSFIDQTQEQDTQRLSFMTDAIRIATLNHYLNQNDENEGISVSDIVSTHQMDKHLEASTDTLLNVHTQCRCALCTLCSPSIPIQFTD